MSKIHINTDSCNDVAKVNLINATIYLNESKSLASSLNPLSFSYSSYIRNLSSEISGVINKHNRTISWLKDSINKYNNYSNDTKETYDKYESIEIKKVESNVNKLY